MKKLLFSTVALATVTSVTAFGQGFAAFGGTGYFYGGQPPPYAYGPQRPGTAFGAGNPGAGILGYDYGGAYSRSWISTYRLPSPSGVFGPYAPAYPYPAFRYRR